MIMWLSSGIWLIYLLLNFLPLDNFAWKYAHPQANDLPRERSEGSYQLVHFFFLIMNHILFYYEPNVNNMRFGYLSLLKALIPLT